MSHLDQDPERLPFREVQSKGQGTVAPEQQLGASPLDKASKTWREKIVQACSEGDIHALRTFFRTLNLTAPQPEIDYRYGPEAQLSDPPSTWEMLFVAVRDQQLTILEYLLDVFPSSKGSYSICHTALVHRNLAIWRTLLNHEPCFLNEKIDVMGRTLLSLACWSMKPELPMLMLDYGADPNVSGFFARPIIELVIPEQPIELIRKLLEKGAEFGGQLVRAARSGRTDVVHCLLDAGVPSSELRQALVAAKNEKKVGVVKVLKERQRRLQWSRLKKVAKTCFGAVQLTVPFSRYHSHYPCDKAPNRHS